MLREGVGCNNPAYFASQGSAMIQLVEARILSVMVKDDTPETAMAGSTIDVSQIRGF